MAKLSEINRKYFTKGIKFGMWNVVGDFEVIKNKLHVLCKCDCGTQRLVSSASLKKGISISCGCHRANFMRKTKSTHGMANTKLYVRWAAIIQRCTNPNHKDWLRYGGRGINVSDEWKNASSFINWALNNGYSEDLEIDRIDNNGNYCSDNCRFVTHKTNSMNRYY
jgi:hypothetical protein